MFLFYLYKQNNIKRVLYEHTIRMIVKPICKNKRRKGKKTWEHSLEHEKLHEDRLQSSFFKFIFSRELQKW